MIKDSVIALKGISSKLSSIDVDIRNRALLSIEKGLLDNIDYILSENRKDLDSSQGLNNSLYKRLILSRDKIETIISGIQEVRGLKDPLGQVQLKRELDSNLTLTRFSVPIGVIGVIFESRPDALVQISSLFIKSGNCGILKGGKEAIHTNRALFKVIRESLFTVSETLASSLELAESREDIKEILELDQYIDLMIPRGGNELVQYIKNNTKIPVMGHTDGICHLFMSKDGDIDMGLKLTLDSKCQYPAVCNAIETLLVEESIAKEFLPRVKTFLEDNKVELRGCDKTVEIIDINRATEVDWDTEYNDYILSIKIVSDLEDAISFINKHGSGHTDCIVTDNSESWDKFLMNVDSASVFLNASTRFADGNRYGFGAEVGISTNKIHSRGPVGLEGLTIYKYKLIGHGDIVADYASGKKCYSHKDIK
ncbi:glutamate-5-semialdehyde dehydrogenase [Thiospirochaeta perfilievii]|uniref:Gamma-glutamyl phosphate reductase n=1 Tax=Thiospirochaeta perfilievii TaxID=252967 RepID=A0A5C1QDR6_9SPIO|nr:glutamate-5-semialdehyde dehydrogenase [Thiospirochaeta perfilievii]QEN05508.1 glutamate-5-semialdehyde dehydrogenase [Thiospirochaeta perfilievii]